MFFNGCYTDFWHICTWKLHFIVSNCKQCVLIVNYDAQVSCGSYQHENYYIQWILMTSRQSDKFNADNFDCHEIANY